MQALRIILCTLLVSLTGCAATGTGKQTFSHEPAGALKPWNHAHFDADKDKFSFAIISDLTGDER